MNFLIIPVAGTPRSHSGSEAEYQWRTLISEAAKNQVTPPQREQLATLNGPFDITITFRLTDPDSADLDNRSKPILDTLWADTSGQGPKAELVPP